MLLDLETLNEYNAICREDTGKAWAKVGNLILKTGGVTDMKVSPSNQDMAKNVVKSLFYKLLEAGRYDCAGTLILGQNYFDARPKFSQDVFRVCSDYALASIVGAASTSKTFSAGIWLLMDFLRDPEFTKIRIAAVNKDHLRENLFSDLVRATNAMIIDLGLVVTYNPMAITTRGIEDSKTIRGSGISTVIFPRDDTRSTGRFRGFKPPNRTSPHPVFGKLGRARLLLDEASAMPKGVHMDLGSVTSTMEGTERVKIIACFNPTERDHWTVDVSSPEGGIESLDIESDHEWKAKSGWHVLRLDAAKSENVVSGTDIYAGIQGRDGYLSHMKYGENSFEYMVYGRGFWPITGQYSMVIPWDFLTKNRGTFLFPDGAKNCASVDLAITTDKVIMTIGRWGKASGYIDQKGAREYFMKEGNRVGRHVLQVDAQIEISGVDKSDTIKLANEIIRQCKAFMVEPEWLVVDKTGVGQGVYDNLYNWFGDIVGISWQKAALESKIFSDDTETAYEVYQNIATEMWFNARNWLEYGVIKISGNVSESPLFEQLTSRRWKKGSTKNARMQVESKDEWVSRRQGKGSCDEADSLVMLPVLCRMRADHLPSARGMDERNKTRQATKNEGVPQEMLIDQPVNLAFMHRK